MAISFQQQGEIDLGRSRIGSTDTYVPVRPEQDSGFEDLAKALGKIGVTFDQVEQSQIEKQEKEIGTWSTKIMTTFGEKATDDDINNTLSHLHPKVRARISEDYGLSVGRQAAQRYIESMPRDVSLDVEKDQANYIEVLKRAEAEAAQYNNNPFFKNGFLKSVRQGLDARSSADSNNRVEKGRAIQKEGFSTRLDEGWRDIADGKRPSGWTGAAVDDPAANPYRTAFENASKETGIPVAVLMAKAKQESGFNANARGGAGEIGLTQILPSTARDPGFGMTGVDPNVLKDPEQNILFGARYLAARAKKAGITDWNDPAQVAKALRAYNGGGDPNYAQNVMRYLPQDYGKPVNTAAVNSTTTDVTAPDNTGPKKEGGVQVAGNNDPNVKQDVKTLEEPPLDPRVKQMRDHFFRLDGEYNASGTIRRAELRDDAAATSMRLAIERRDPAFLEVLPQNLLTPEIRDKFNKAREHIADLKWQDYSRAKQMKDDKRVEDDRKFKNAMTTKFLKEGRIDPENDAKDETGMVNFERRQFLLGLQETSNIPSYQSQNVVSKFEDDLFEAGTTGKYDKLFGKDPVLGPIIASGKFPTGDQIRDHVMNRSDIHPKHKDDLIKKVDTLMDGMALMQDPGIARAYKEGVGTDVDVYVKSAQGMGIAVKYPAFSSDVQREFQKVIRQEIQASIEDGKGVPRGRAKADIIEKAEKAARERMKFIIDTKGQPDGPKAGQTTPSQTGRTAPAPKVGDIRPGKDGNYTYVGGPPGTASSWKKVE